MKDAYSQGTSSSVNAGRVAITQLSITSWHKSVAVAIEATTG